MPVCCWKVQEVQGKGYIYFYFFQPFPTILVKSAGVSYFGHVRFYLVIKKKKKNDHRIVMWSWILVENEKPCNGLQGWDEMR